MQTNVTYWLDQTERKYPDKTGFVDENKSMTFRDMKSQALKIATLLVREKLFKEPIGIYMEKSVDEVAAFMGVAYSGNFYSPIDASMPVSRIEKILEVFEPKVIITKQELCGNIDLKNKDIRIICLEDIEEFESDESAVYAQRKRCCDTDLLYVLFTSGSTGVPKGVTICHQSVIDYIDWVEEAFSMDAGCI